MVNMPITPDWSESYKQNVEPLLFSMSKDIDSSLHIWKKVLYWMVERPGWCKNEQYMNARGSLIIKLEASFWSSIFNLIMGSSASF